MVMESFIRQVTPSHRLYIHPLLNWTRAAIGCCDTGYRCESAESCWAGQVACRSQAYQLLG